MSGSSLGNGPRNDYAGAHQAAARPAGGAPPQPGDRAMHNEPLRRRVVITNPQGFHMRPMHTFVQLANQFASTVTLARDDQRVNGKSQWELMLLAAEAGTELTLEVAGPDAPAALEALAEILAAPSADDLPEPPLPKKG